MILLCSYFVFLPCLLRVVLRFYVLIMCIILHIRFICFIYLIKKTQAQPHLHEQPIIPPFHLHGRLGLSTMPPLPLGKPSKSLLNSCRPFPSSHLFAHWPCHTVCTAKRQTMSCPFFEHSNPTAMHRLPSPLFSHLHAHLFLPPHLHTRPFPLIRLACMFSSPYLPPLRPREGHHEPIPIPLACKHQTAMPSSHLLRPFIIPILI